MSKVEELISRVSQLEETVSHLTTHHDEQFLLVHDDVTRDTCDRLFNVNLQQRKRTTAPRRRRMNVRRQ
jgi:Rps23 Pro-64 3,4-dihydroxylase Tpa1-like proline 4-hydroxylase